jgi:hypothetical protein
MFFPFFLQCVCAVGSSQKTPSHLRNEFTRVQSGQDLALSEPLEDEFPVCGQGRLMPGEASESTEENERERGGNRRRPPEELPP